MFAANFDYSAPSSLDEVIELLARYGDSARLVAGGHSLIPLMKLRFVQPGHVIDLRHISALSGVRVDAASIVIGATTTHGEIASDSDIRTLVPILSEAAALIGDPQVRNRGTIGGSLAHADPGADLPAVILALNAEITAVGAGGTRTITASDFFLGLMTTALAPGEVLTQIRIARPFGRTGGAYSKHPHPASRYAVVGVAAVLGLSDDGQSIRDARIAITGLGANATRAFGVEEALTGGAGSAQAIGSAVAKITTGIDIRVDLQGDAAYKANLARVHASRALSRALERARTA
jgi:carbon-monoxide dehydrogenase medium subunit